MCSYVTGQEEMFMLLCILTKYDNYDLLFSNYRNHLIFTNNMHIRYQWKSSQATPVNLFDNAVNVMHASSIDWVWDVGHEPTWWPTYICEPITSITTEHANGTFMIDFNSWL